MEQQKERHGYGIEDWVTPLLGIDLEVRSTQEGNNSSDISQRIERRGMVLPFQPLSLAFNHVNYYIDTPFEMKARGVKGNRLQLLKDVSGAFRPGILTALIGDSGAGKTSLLDVLAGRYTGGYTEGHIFISGYPKNQSTFARVSGYCEQMIFIHQTSQFMNLFYTLHGYVYSQMLTQKHARYLLMN